MKKLLLILFLALMISLCTAQAENTEILGKAFPDFTATDTAGNSFTLSEALQDHEAVLINIWATWCPPCAREFPYLNEAYKAYGDRVAFIALSCEAQDTLEKIGEYRESHGVNFSMGRDEGQTLAAYTGAYSIPTTVIVDRFGNAAFMHMGSFMSAGEIERLLEAFLGEGYTQTAVLQEIPKDTATRLLPVSAERGIIVDNKNAQRVNIQVNEGDIDLLTYVINDAAASLRLEITAEDNLSDMIYYDAGAGQIMELQSLLDPDRGVYAYRQELPGAADADPYTVGMLVNYYDESDPDGLGIYLIQDEDCLEQFIGLLRDEGYTVSWTYAEETAEASGTEYLLHVADQNGDPVPGVYINFCTDTACTTVQSDADGVIRFDGAPDVYHLVLLKVPDGYSFDQSFEGFTPPIYSEWVLRIKKD